jgi:hypothetical protein
MGIWSLLGGAASGFDQESKYNDAKARQMREEAMRAREQVLRETNAAQEQEARKKAEEFRMKQEERAIKSDEATAQFRHDEALRHIELMKANRQNTVDEIKARRDYLIQEQKFKLEHPELIGSNPSRDKFLQNLPEDERMLFEATSGLYDKPLGDTETLESRQAQIEAMREKVKELYPRLFPPKQKEATPSKGVIDVLFKGIKTQEDAVNEWRKYKAKDPVRSSVVDEDEVMNYIQTLPRKRAYGPENRPFGAPINPNEPAGLQVVRDLVGSSGDMGPSQFDLYRQRNK